MMPGAQDNEARGLLSLAGAGGGAADPGTSCLAVTNNGLGSGTVGIRKRSLGHPSERLTGGGRLLVLLVGGQVE